MTDLFKTQIPQLIISVLVIAGIFLLLVLHVITTTDPVFFAGGGVLGGIIIYWFSVGQQRIQHTHTMELLKGGKPDDGPAPLKLRATAAYWQDTPDKRG